MYGLVNRGLQEFIEKSSGDSTWAQISARLGLATEPFVDLEHHPDEVTYRIVDAASEVLGVPAPQLLRRFGRHWILFAAESAYGDLIHSSGDLFEFLVNVDALHASVAELMPKLVAPSFGVDGTVEQIANSSYGETRFLISRASV
ncbi:MAG: heme NO-binding protein [bacterium]|nr:heme NO-binding protein [bacterium]